MKNSMLIHRMADWLDKKYFRPNTVSARARLPAPPCWYRPIADSTAAATPSISHCSARQNQPSQSWPLRRDKKPWVRVIVAVFMGACLRGVAGILRVLGGLVVLGGLGVWP